jgi:hypothetical protein
MSFAMLSQNFSGVIYHLSSRDKIVIQCVHFHWCSCPNELYAQLAGFVSHALWAFPQCFLLEAPMVQSSGHGFSLLGNPEATRKKCNWLVHIYKKFQVKEKSQNNHSRSLFWNKGYMELTLQAHRWDSDFHGFWKSQCHSTTHIKSSKQ